MAAQLRCLVSQYTVREKTSLRGRHQRAVRRKDKVRTGKEQMKLCIGNQTADWLQDAADVSACFDEIGDNTADMQVIG